MLVNKMITLMILSVFTNTAMAHMSSHSMLSVSATIQHYLSQHGGNIVLLLLVLLVGVAAKSYVSSKM